MAVAETNQVAVNDEDLARISRYRGKSCFVIMPFGIKTHPFTGEDIDFDGFYDTVITETLSRVFEADNFKRSDGATTSGLIHSEMIDEIISSDLAIVDITTANPNVMYELGVRHAAKRNGTVVIKRQGDDHKIPFNVGGVRAFEYPEPTDGEAMQAFRQVLLSAIEHALDGGQVDSLVHGLHRGLNVTRRPRPIRKREVHAYRWPEDMDDEIARELCIITGDIADVIDIDVWVNPENTAMQMGRFYDDSVSASIRYFGAKRDANGFVKHDTVSKKLRRAIARLPVTEPGTVVITGSGRLKVTNGVQKIVHVAAQYGEPSKGYLPVRNVPGCVTNCLSAVDGLNRKHFARARDRVEYDSVLFPLWGVRSSHLVPEQAAYDLIEAAALHFEKNMHSLIERAYFLAYTDVDLALCEQALKRLGMSRHSIEPDRRRRVRKGRKKLEQARKTKQASPHFAPDEDNPPR